MLLPYRSDAPVYHLPWGTGALIALNLVVHLILWSGAIDVETIVDWWILPFGEGFTPLRWITSAFAHAGWMHLIGNMIFLWTFGLIVEGKVGWLRLLGLYGTICVLVGLSEQTLMWTAARGGSLGASSAIYGLMAIAWLWAPKNVMDCLFLFGWVARSVELPIWGVCAIYIGWDMLTALLTQRMGTALLHVLGALAGAPLGYLLLRRRWVDCEGWDLLSLRTGAPARARDPMVLTAAGIVGLPAKVAAAPIDPTRLRAESLPELQRALAAGEIEPAMTVYESVSRVAGSWPLQASDHKRMIDLLVQAKRWEEASRHCDGAMAVPALRSSAVLTRAQILIAVDQRPAKALALLASLDANQLGQRTVSYTHLTLPTNREV